MSLSSGGDKVSDEVAEKLITLKANRKVQWQELCRISGMLKGITQTYNELTKQYEEAKKLYEKTDHDLALIDGRAQKIAPAVSGRRGPHPKEPPPITELTQEQINELLAALDPPSLVMEVPTPEEVAAANDLSALEEEDDNKE